MAPRGAIFGELIGSIRTCKLQLRSDLRLKTQILSKNPMVDQYHLRNHIRRGIASDRNPPRSGQSASRYR